MICSVARCDHPATVAVIHEHSTRELVYCWKHDMTRKKYVLDPKSSTFRPWLRQHPKTQRRNL